MKYKKIGIIIPLVLLLILSFICIVLFCGKVSARKLSADSGFDSSWRLLPNSAKNTFILSTVLTRCMKSISEKLAKL